MVLWHPSDAVLSEKPGLTVLARLEFDDGTQKLVTKTDPDGSVDGLKTVLTLETVLDQDHVVIPSIRAQVDDFNIVPGTIKVKLVC